METDFILPLSIVFGLVSYSLIAKWYVMPALARRPRNEALAPLLFLHCFRYIGMAFLIPGVTTQTLDPRFANPAAWGDLLAAVLALIAIFALRLRWTVTIPLVWIFNIVGSLDLLNALFQGLRHTEDGHLGATYFIPAVAVPALLVTHYMIFVLLLKRAKTVGVEV
jgi:hypothetical protein